MTTEIELTFMLTAEAKACLLTKIAVCAHRQEPPVALTRTYFDTPDHQLRNQKIGLRICDKAAHYVMTLKTKGAGSAGIQERQEHSLNVSELFPEITRLPREIWPSDWKMTEATVQQLQTRLQPVFVTAFQREIWHVNWKNSEIEVAFDQGAIHSGDLSYPLYEMEFELKTGNRDDLITFVSHVVGDETSASKRDKGNGDSAVPICGDEQELMKEGQTESQFQSTEQTYTIDGVRLGSLSKAARGYWLAEGKPHRSAAPLSLLKLKPKASVEDAIGVVFSTLFNQWKDNEERWLESDLAQEDLKQTLENIGYAFSLFGSIVSRKATRSLREKLTSLVEIVSKTSASDAQKLCYSARYLDAQLSFTHWCTSFGWRAFMEEKDLRKVKDSFKRFADITLGRIAADLKATFKTIHHANEFQDKAGRLARQLTGVLLLAGAYPENDVTRWLENWQQLLLAIRNGKNNEAQSYCHKAIKQKGFWFSTSGERNSVA